MRRTLMAMAASALFLAGCDSAQQAPTAENSTFKPVTGTANLVVHSASLGGADVCEALGQPTGCDANFSLVATQNADGSVSGQWEDTFAGGNGRVHVQIDCLAVAGNAAVIGGVVTQASGQAAGAVGTRALTAVVDNGMSKNDAPDLMSFSIFPVGPTCNQVPAGAFPLLPLTNGQVVVR